MAMVTTTRRREGILRRPTATTGFSSWFTTIDHKKIGILYGATALVFFLVGGLEALLIRSQLAGPDGTLLNADQYNQIFTMHGVTMIFLFVMPMSAAFFNYFIPLMIGARDVAFPRLNAYSYWVFLLGGLFLYSSFFLGGAPNCGWFCYAPNSIFDPTIGPTFYALGLIITGIASTAGAVNLAVTVINMRAPGMSLFRVPVFVWMGLVVQLLLVFSLPIITVALFQLLFDREFGTHFFDPTAGGEPLLWQHLFWLFGHPEVYILILPAFGIISEILPVFSRKPLFGYQFVVFSGIAIGFIGFGVWAHHMFAAGLGPVANTAFGVSTAIIAMPTGMKIFNWMGTMYRGDIRFTSAMLFAIGTVTMFVIGGLSGVTHAIVPSDYQQTDTYYIVAHFHYVIFGGGVFGLFGGIYYWWPKVFGRMLSERPREAPVLDDAHRVQPDVRSDAHPRPPGDDPPHVHVPRVAGAHVLEPGGDGRLVPDRAVDARVPRERRADPAEGAARGRRRRRPVGRAHARVDDPVAAPGLQLRRDPHGARAGRVLAPQVRGGRADRPARARSGRGGGRALRGAEHSGGHAHPSAGPVVLAAGRRVGMP